MEDLEREKGIKFFECVGDPPASDSFIENVKVQRQNFITETKNELRKKDVNRFATEVNNDKVVVPIEASIASRPKWDIYQNNHFAMRKRLVNIFLKVANKQIIRMRAGKRLKLIKNRFAAEGVMSREDCKRMVAKDFKHAQSMQIGDDEATDNINNVPFQFSFNVADISADIRLPLEYESGAATFTEKIEAQPVIDFDDLEAYDAIEQLDFEVMGYSQFPPPAVSTYDPVFGMKSYRPGCEYESAIRQRSGEPDLERIQQKAHDVMEMLKTKTKEIVSGANVAMVSSFLKPLDFSVELLVTAHPTLRQYQEMLSCSEVDPEYHLYPIPRPRFQPKDEIEMKSSKKDALEASKTQYAMTASKTVSGSFVNTCQVPTYDLPGNFGVRVIETMPTDQRTVFVEQLNNIDLGFVCDQRVTQMPLMLEKPDENDYLTDEEDDDGGDFEVQVPQLDTLLDQFEQDDDVILTEKQEMNEELLNLKRRGFEPEDRFEIRDDRASKC